MGRFVDTKKGTQFLVACFVSLWLVILLPVLVGITSMLSKAAAAVITVVLAAALLTWLFLTRPKGAE